jgi:hypothetical protein
MPSIAATCRWALVALAFSTLSTSGWGQEVTLTDLLTGKTVPLVMPLKALATGWVQATVRTIAEPDPGVERAGSGVPPASVVFTKGQTVSVDGEKYLIAYTISRQTPLIGADTEAATATLLTPETPVSLALLKLRAIGSLQELRPFDLTQATVKGTRELAARTQSTANLRELAVAVVAYAKAHEQLLPEAMAWVDAIKGSTDATRFTQPTTDAEYAMNPLVSGKKLGDLADAAQTILFYEPIPWSDGSRSVVSLDGQTASLSAARWNEIVRKLGIP